MYPMGLSQKVISHRSLPRRDCVSTMLVIYIGCTGNWQCASAHVAHTLCFGQNDGASDTFVDSPLKCSVEMLRAEAIGPGRGYPFRE
jgi:hypothetical protein